MKTADVEHALDTATGQTLLRFPSGLLGFEKVKAFALVSRPEDQPFSWLQASEDPALAFLMIPSFPFFPEYQPDIPSEDVRSLGLDAPEDALLFNIVTLRPKNGATANLKGPIVINRHTGVAKQVVLANAVKYSVQHPLPVAE